MAVAEGNFRDTAVNRGNRPCRPHVCAGPTRVLPVERRFGEGVLGLYGALLIPGFPGAVGRRVLAAYAKETSDGRRRDATAEQRAE
ncbi:hypothetical protein [Streptomyces sp. NPDC001568]|uniref:hypothetical protein n=1 Tax=Streptomyces sp. NPDC001568 TaxID=3364588 RepID=UPI0036A41B78